MSCHDDGSFTYFDHFLDQWMTRMPLVPAHVMATMPDDERARVARRAWHHLGARSAPAAAIPGARPLATDRQDITGPPQGSSRAGYAVNPPTFLRVLAEKQGAEGVTHV